MNKKILFLIILVACFLIPQVSLADVIVGPVYRAASPQVQPSYCIYFKGLNNIGNYKLFVKYAVYDDNNFGGVSLYTGGSVRNVSYYSLVEMKEGVCYPVYDDKLLEGIESALDKNGSILSVYAADKRLINKDFEEKIKSINPNNIGTHYGSLDNANTNWMENSLFYNVSETIDGQRISMSSLLQSLDSFSDEHYNLYAEGNILVYKYSVETDENSPIRHVDRTVEFYLDEGQTKDEKVGLIFQDVNGKKSYLENDIKSSQSFLRAGKDNRGNNLLVVGFLRDPKLYSYSYFSNLKWSDSFEVNYKNDSVKNFSAEDFQSEINKYQPRFVAVSPFTDSKTPYSGTTSFSWFVFLTLTILIEGIIFYRFGSRHKRNYIILVLVNVISYIFGTFLFRSLFFAMYGFFWGPILIAEIMVLFLEFILYLIFFRKRYAKKEIFLFVLVANSVTAFLGVIISFFMTYFGVFLNGPF